MSLDQWQRHLQQALVTIELGLAAVLVYFERQKLVQHKVRALHNQLSLFHIQLHLSELSVRQPDLDED